MFNQIFRKFFFNIKSNSQDFLKSRYYIASTYNSSVLVASLLITGLILGVRQLDQLKILELVAYDRLVNLSSTDYTDPRLLVVEITDSDIQQQNQWPITDEVYAELLTKLQKYQPKVIGLDIYRDISHPPGNEALRKQLQAKNVISIKEIEGVPSPKGVPQEQIGFNDHLLDVDNVLRRYLMYTEYEGQEFYSFSLRLSLSYLRDRPLQFKVLDNSLLIGDTEFVALDKNSGGYQMRSSEASGWQVLLNYKSPDITEKITLTDALAENFDPNLVKDKVVLIGTTAPSIKDFFYTPYHYSTMPGVIVHAHMTSQILSAVLDDARQFWFWSEWIEGLWIWGWSIAGAAIAWKIRHPLGLCGAGIIGVAGLWGIYFLAFTQGVWIPFVATVIAFILTSSSNIAYNFFYAIFYDTLTGLPNRFLFTKQLKKLKNQNKPDKLLVVFLSRFRPL